MNKQQSNLTPKIKNYLIGAEVTGKSKFVHPQHEKQEILRKHQKREKYCNSNDKLNDVKIKIINTPRI